MEENFASLLQQLTEQGQEVVSDLIGQDVNLSNPPASLPETTQDTIASFQQLVELGQQQVLSILEQNTGGSLGENPVGSFSGVGNSGSDNLTGSGEGNSVSGVSFNFVPANEGTVDPVTGSEVLGQVELVADGESTPLFSLSFGGPLPFLSDEQQLSIGGSLPSFLSNTQQVGDTTLV